MALLDDSAMDDFLDFLENSTAAENHLLETAIKKLHEQPAYKKGFFDRIISKKRKITPESIPAEFSLADELRVLRQKMQQKFFFGENSLSAEQRTKFGELACFLKHVNFARTTLKETAQKLWRDGKTADSIEMFEKWHLLGKMRLLVISQLNKGDKA